MQHVIRVGKGCLPDDIELQLKSEPGRSLKCFEILEKSHSEGMAEHSFIPLHRQQGLNLLRQVFQPRNASTVPRAVGVPIAGFRMESKTASQVLHIHARETRLTRAGDTVAVMLLAQARCF